MLFRSCFDTYRLYRFWRSLVCSCSSSLLPRCSSEVDALRFRVVAALPLSFPFAALCHFCSLVVAVLDNRVRRFLRSVVELRRVLLSVGSLALFPGVCSCVHLFFCSLHYCLASGWRLRCGFLRTIMATTHCSFKVFSSCPFPASLSFFGGSVFVFFFLG